MMDEKKFQYLTIGGLGILFLFLILIFVAVAGGERKEIKTSKSGKEVTKKAFYLFNHKIFSWK